MKSEFINDVARKVYLFEKSDFVFELQNSENASVEFQYVKDPIISDLSSPYTMLLCNNSIKEEKLLYLATRLCDIPNSKPMYTAYTNIMKAKEIMFPWESIKGAISEVYTFPEFSPTEVNTIYGGVKIG